MRTLASLVTVIALTACDAPPASGPTDPQRDDPSEVLSGAHELTLPVTYASSHEVIVYAELDGDQATDLTELSYGLADGYPRQVEINPKDGFILDNACQLEPGIVVWRSIVDVQGTAASVELIGGALAARLREEGTVTALLEGEIAAQHCTFGDEPSVTTVPLQHRVVLQVHQVEGFVVEQLHQVLADCWESMVLPSDALLRAPTAKPLDGAGQPFEPLNAPTPVTITLRSDGALTPADQAGQFWAEPGEVSVSVDTTLPVHGLRSFDVVGPDALTSVDAALYLQKAASKGSVVERIEDGMSYRVFFPELRNTVEVQVESAMTTHGKLCANVPGTWFASSSATPEQCAADPGSPEEFSSAIPIATIVSDGECRLQVTIPGTSHEWNTQFKTTH